MPTTLSQTLYTLPPEVVFQEIPDEISLCFTVLGCPWRCPGCHSSHTWRQSRGEPLTLDRFISLITPYRGMVSCVLFMGGDWQPDALLPLLTAARELNFKTALYGGSDSVPDSCCAQLNYLKTGRWITALGGLDSPTTNQRLINLDTNELLNPRMQAMAGGSLRKISAYSA